MPRPEDDACAQLIFDRIITSRARDDWRLHDPVLVAQLAVVEVELDKIMQILSGEGWTVMGGKHGTAPVRGPLVDPAQHLSTRSLALSRALGITGTPVDAKMVAKNGRIVIEARAAINDDDFSLEDDPRSLLAGGGSMVCP